MVIGMESAKESERSPAPRRPTPHGPAPQGPTPRRPTPRRPVPRRPSLRRVVLASLAGSVVLGGFAVLLPRYVPRDTPPPAPGPVARAMTAAGAGVPAALPDLVALIGDREAYLRAHPRSPEAAQTWALLGAAYVERGQRTSDSAFFPKADQALRASLKVRQQRNPDALNGLAALAGARHDFTAAKKWGEEAVRLAPKRWTSYPALIDAYTGLGDVKAAGRSLETLVTLRTGTVALTQAGQVYRERGWREDAATTLSDAAALARTPAEEALCLHRAGDLAWERGDPAAALRFYDTALRADPDRHETVAARARALAALGRTQDAVRAYKTAQAKRSAPEYALELGELYESQRMDAQARTEYDRVRSRVRERAADGVEDGLLLGLFEADHGDPEVAVQGLRAEWKRVGSGRAADALAWALHRAGNDKEALEFARKAAEKGPRTALASYHRAEIERALGDEGGARRHLDEALRTNPYFSPLLAPRARDEREALGDAPPGGPEEVEAPPGAPVELPTPAPRPKPPAKR
ncbi:tetratricopeptide repeat protein [Streptomyces sp. NPDC058001]|uniref:tetratricopeptide repeat protein n=1 Tax=Streptomyces sp. NPDC058001 TaxID=3346300 RepID=UPI0036E7E550